MLHPSLFADPSSLERARTARLGVAALAVLFSYVFLANAWLGDDAHITFRVVWNFVNGYGLTFNPDERVQAVTHPLWTLVLAAGHASTREFLVGPLAISWACGIGLLIVLHRRFGSVAATALALFWLLSSKAFVDYTSSGLEYPLSYLLLGLFYTRYLASTIHRDVDPSEAGVLTLIACLGLLNRPDAILLYAVPLGEIAARTLIERRWHALGAMLLALTPAAIWFTFATIYYGFPLPNTYYAKVANGIPESLLYAQGLAYLANSLAHDPVTLGTIALAGIVAAGTPGPPRRAALSALAYVAYVVAVGGDFMSGRFFAMPFLLAVTTLVPLMTMTTIRWAAATLLVYNLVAPIAPIKTTPGYQAAWPWRSQNGVRDERGHTHQVSNILMYAPFRPLPDHVWVREATSFRNGPEKVTVQGSIGMWGLYAGPSKFIVDRNALSDPLLARLPVSPRLYFEFYAGHYFRDIPEGYLESVARDQNLLQDPLLHAYYDRLRNVTRGPIFRLARLRDVWALNVGRYRNIHDAYERRRPVALSIPADNERFQTDVGARTAGVLRTTGRTGYLEYGPGIPMKRGYYRVRWIGTVEAVSSEEALGEVEVWTSPDECLVRAPIEASANQPHTVVAQIDFQLPSDVMHLDYRLFVKASASMTLERIELYNGHALAALDRSASGRP